MGYRAKFTIKLGCNRYSFSLSCTFPVVFLCKFLILALKFANSGPCMFMFTSIL